MSDSSPITLPPSGSRRELKFTGDFKEAIFGKTIMKMPLPSPWGGWNIQIDYDPLNEYKLNNYDYRGPDFTSDVDIITAGCSFTFGIGVPDAGTWSYNLSKLLDASYVNISMPGASIDWVINSIYRYIDTFGPPKRGIIAFLPDLIRHDVVLNSKINEAVDTSNLDFVPRYVNDESNLELLSYTPRGYPAPNFIKRPYPIEHTLVLEETIRSSVLKIRDLERFCKHAGIKLIWSSWADSVVWLNSEMPEEYKFDNYISLDGLADWKSHMYRLEPTTEDPEGIADYKIHHEDGKEQQYGCSHEQFLAEKCVCFTRCHFDRLPEFPESFHSGTDRYRPGNSHYGVHRYLHVAEDFAVKALEIGL